MLQNACRYSGLGQGCHVVFENVDFLRRFGVPRKSSDSFALLQQLSDADKHWQERWFRENLLVSCPHMCANSAQWQHKLAIEPCAWQDII